MIHGQPYDADVLEDAVAFEGVANQPNRIGCATIGWRAMEEMIEDYEKDHPSKQKEEASK